MQDLFEAMSRDPRFQLRVYYLEMAAPDTYWGQQPLPDYAEVLPGRWFWFAGGRIHYNPGAAKRILHDDPDVVVINGYSGLTNQIVMRQLRRRAVPWIFFGELPGMNRRGLLGRALRAVARRPAVRWPAAIAAVGSTAAAAYRALAPDSCPVENIPYCCDLQPFFAAPRTASPNGAVRFLYCGQLIHRKGVDLLASAFVQLARKNPKATLTFVGEGPLHGDLARLIPPELNSRIHFAGFQPIESLPRWFSQADVLVLPSRHDGWGVVVNQAIAAGLAVICSDAVGAAADLVEPQANGFIFPSGDQPKLAECLAQPRRPAESGRRHGPPLPRNRRALDARARRGALASALFAGCRPRRTALIKTMSVELAQPTLPGATAKQPPLRVLLATASSGSQGGGELYLVGLAGQLRTDGHQVEALLSDHPRMHALAELLTPFANVHRVPVRQHVRPPAAHARLGARPAHHRAANKAIPPDRPGHHPCQQAESGGWPRSAFSGPALPACRT